MSVICGFLSFSNDKSTLVSGNRMISQLDNIPADRIENWHNENIYMSCHHQFITPESVNEVLPYYDKEAGIVIVADAIIDNRDELLHVLRIQSNDRARATDSQLILAAYKKWGEDCSKYLLGDYTYVIYEEKTKKLVCARDHAGISTFYYTVNSSYFAFCSIMKPLHSINDDKELNEQWIADFLSIPSVISELDTSITVYRAIKQLQPANTLVLLDGKVKLTKYWDALKAPKIKFKSDAEYDEAFREVTTEAVRCKLRSVGNIGIQLSGGFDSCTIGCIAAGVLQNEGKRLKAYTSVPMDGYIERYGKNAISDESSYVMEIAKKYSNIDTNFCRSEGKDSFHDIDKYLGVIEQPYKVVENLFWNFAIYEKAKKDNCKVLLNGQYGNMTISYSDFFVNFNTLLMTGKLFKLIHEINMYSRNYNIGRKKIIKDISIGMLPFIGELTNAKTMKSRFNRTFSLVNQEFAERYNMYERLDKMRYSDKNHRGFTLNGFRKYVSAHPTLSQSAAFGKKLDLHYGLVARDPTKDKRLIEFCFGLPSDQYVRNGRNKIILRRTMDGVIPDTTRLNYTKRGVQAADWIQRLIPLWDEITSEVKECISDKRIEKYINTKGVLNFLNENKELKLNTNFADLRQTIATYIFSRFIFLAEGE